MKKKLAITLMLAGLFLCGFSGKEEKLYPRATIVVNVDYENDLVTCADSAGNHWEFYGCDGWYKGTICTLLLSDEGTPEIEDDIIVDKYNDGVIDLLDMQVGWEETHIICDVAEYIHIDGKEELYV